MFNYRKCLFRAAIFFLILYLLFCGIVFFKPQWFFYHPSTATASLAEAHRHGYSAQEVHYNSADGTPLLAWFTPPQPGKNIIVFFHGNSHNIESFYHKLLPFVEAGYGTLLPEYRGFGSVPGSITQTGLEQDALAAINYLYSRGFSNQDIILYGFSLGSHMAVNSGYELGNEQPFAAMLLEVPFDSLYNTVKHHVSVPLPLKYLVRDRYENLDRITGINSPVFIMAAEDDRVVPLPRAQNLYHHAMQPKKMKVYPQAGHNDLYIHGNYKDILAWLEQHEKTGY